jgi:short-subunit dehydrogenase
VKVQLVNPGFIKTRMTDKNDFPMPQLMSAQDAAAEMAEHMSTDAFRRNFPAGLATAVRFGQLLPDWAYTRIFPRK